MFEELNKYANHGHFIFESGDVLSEVSNKVPNKPGVYYIHKLANGRPELVYIGKSGTMKQNGQFKPQLLYKRLNNKQDGMKRQQYFENKIKEENINALDIHWFVTFDENHRDIPAYIEGVLIQKYFEIYKRLPPWNKCY